MAEPTYDAIPADVEAVADATAPASIMDRATALLPELPESAGLVFDPTTDFTPQQRAKLLVESCYPWSEFASPSNFDLPPVKSENAPIFSEWKGRITKNITAFFYNYVVIALAFFALYSATHFATFIQVALLAALAYLLFFQAPEIISVGDFDIGSKGKKIILAIALALAVFKGGVGCAIFSLALFSFVLVAVHASIFDSEKL